MKRKGNMLSRHLRIKKYFYLPVSASNFVLNFYARFLSFSRETTLLVSASGRLRGEAYPQSPPAGALLLKKEKKRKEKGKERRKRKRGKKEKKGKKKKNLFIYFYLYLFIYLYL